MAETDVACQVHWVLFDFGGVLAEEGFVQGLGEIARLNGQDPALVLSKAQEHIHASGYLLGQGRESDFWERMRQELGLVGQEDDWRQNILHRFIIRDWMLELVRRIRATGTGTAILSDQVDWLDRLNAEHGFFSLFDRVFNSYHLGRSKADPGTFELVLRKLQCKPEQALFIDDSPGHIQRAKQAGLCGILYQDRQDFLEQLQEYCPGAVA
ncbi:MAG: HAD family hydrolase [Desulfohalobiaceae bacterium]